MKRAKGTALQPQLAPGPTRSSFDVATDQLRSAVAQAQAAFAEHSGPVAKKAGAVARVAIGKEVRRVVRSGAGEIGEVVAGETGRDVASYAATVGLGWLCCGLLPFDDDDAIPLEDHTNEA
jgi:hypothetical protein